MTLSDPQPFDAEYNSLMVIRDVLSGGASQDDLLAIAETFERICNAMRKRREEVERIDPWRWGLLIAILDERLKDGRRLFEVLQNAGYWQDYDFREWCNEMTGKSPNTWRVWARAAEVYLLTTDSRVRGGLSVAEFIAQVHMDKALRFLGTVSAGALTERQAQILIDPETTSHQARMAIAAMPDAAIKPVPNVAENNDSDEIQYELHFVDGALYLKSTGGQQSLICRFAVTRRGSIVHILQEAMLNAAYRTLDDCRRNQWHM